ncbi:hypothetical protein K469DRAFT_697445, partial [Zopfia rhizophila CBS 207.26]
NERAGRGTRSRAWWWPSVGVREGGVATPPSAGRAASVRRALTRPGQRRVAVVRKPQAFVLVQLEEADRDGEAAAVAQGAHQGQVGAVGGVDAEPVARGGIAAGGVVLPVEEGLDDPGCAADGGAAEAGAPVAVVLEIEDGADGDGADAERVVAALAARGVILAQHQVRSSTVFRGPALPGRSAATAQGKSVVPCPSGLSASAAGWSKSRPKVIPVASAYRLAADWEVKGPKNCGALSSGSGSKISTKLMPRSSERDFAVVEHHRRERRRPVTGRVQAVAVVAEAFAHRGGEAASGLA